MVPQGCLARPQYVMSMRCCWPLWCQEYFSYVFLPISKSFILFFLLGYFLSLRGLAPPPPPMCNWHYTCHVLPFNHCTSQLHRCLPVPGNSGWPSWGAAFPMVHVSSPPFQVLLIFRGPASPHLPCVSDIVHATALLLTCCPHSGALLTCQLRPFDCSHACTQHYHLGACSPLPLPTPLLLSAMSLPLPLRVLAPFVIAHTAHFILHGAGLNFTTAASLQ
jgi:hypothetical protein